MTFILTKTYIAHQWMNLNTCALQCISSQRTSCNNTICTNWSTMDTFMSKYKKGMYGLPQAGRLANDRLGKLLGQHGYRPVPLTPGLWRHDTNSITFTLVVDDFGVKYTNRADVEHLLRALKENYEVTEDWSGSRYCGLTVAWDYTNCVCDISMPGYVERALQRFQHPAPRRPHEWQQPVYGAKTQYAPQDNTSPLLNKNDTTRVQGQFIIRWKLGSMNLADYCTKHHPASHHQAIRSVYIHSNSNPKRNYFECLQDQEDVTTDQGEGVLDLPNHNPNERPLTGSDPAVTIPDPLVHCHADQRTSTPLIGMIGGQSTSSAHNFT
jgi:CheY-like chemotaxis protein